MQEVNAYKKKCMEGCGYNYSIVSLCYNGLHPVIFIAIRTLLRHKHGLLFVITAIAANIYFTLLLFLNKVCMPIRDK